MPNRLKQIVKRSLARTPFPEMLVRGGATHHLTSVAYHRIMDAPGSDFPFDDELISASPDEFRRELTYLKRNFDMISVKELANGLKQQDLPKRPAVITFDDGYLDNYEIALPLLVEARLSACFFLSSHLVGTENIPWWDQVACCFKFSQVRVVKSPFGGRDADYCTDPQVRTDETRRFLDNLKSSPWPCALEYLEDLKRQTKIQPAEHATQPLFMSWDLAREMARAGMEVGGHTRTHPVLGRYTDEAAIRDEIVGCRDDLRRELNIEPIAFSYPVGSDDAMSEVCDRVIEEAGFEVSFSYAPYLTQRIPASPWRLPRFHAEFGDDFDEFRLSLSRAVSASPDHRPPYLTRSSVATL